MIGRICGFAAGVALALLSAMASAATPSISTADNTAANTFLSDLDGMIGQQRTDSNRHLANVQRGTSDVIWFDPLKDRANAFGYNRITQQDAEWMRSNIRLYEIYEQLGGNAIGREQQFRTGSQGFYVGLDGFAGRWFGTSGEAQGYLFKLLISSSSEILPAVKQAVANVASNDIGTVLQVARDAMAANRAFVARGSNNTLIIQGSGFGAGGAAPRVVIPNGIAVGPVVLNSSEQITVPVAIAADATLGDRRVLVFNPGEALVPIVEFRLAVVRGSGTPTTIADDHADTLGGATTLTVGVGQTGFLGSATDVDLFKLVPAANGTLKIDSNGTTDLVGELLDSGGATLVSNDDGGGWYNFHIERAVTGGATYYLRVRHCCAGSGSYTISTTLN